MTNNTYEFTEKEELLFESEEIRYEKIVENNVIIGYEFFKFSPYGQDFSFACFGKDKSELIQAVYNYYIGFDCSEETSYWLDNEGHGINGAPYDMKDVYEDMEACQQYILDVYNILIEED